MRVEITAVDEAKRIQAIKCVRAATGMGLKDAKYTVDEVAFGRPQCVDVGYGGKTALDEGYMTYREMLPNISVRDFVEVLSRYPRGLSVGELADTLIVVRDLDATPVFDDRGGVA